MSPYCGEADPIVRDIQERLGEQLRFVFRNVPIGTSNPHGFWEMLQRHLDDQPLLSALQRAAESDAEV